MADDAGEQLEALKRSREAELQVRSALQVILDSSALQRLSLMRVSNANLYGQIVQYLFSLYNAGRIKGKIGEEELKRIASMFISQKKETTITRMSK